MFSSETPGRGTSERFKIASSRLRSTSPEVQRPLSSGRALPAHGHGKDEPRHLPGPRPGADAACSESTCGSARDAWDACWIAFDPAPDGD